MASYLNEAAQHGFSKEEALGNDFKKKEAK
jgi:hypothetical protein